MAMGGAVTIAVFRIVEGVKVLVRKGFCSLQDARAFVADHLANADCAIFRVDDFGIVGAV